MGAIFVALCSMGAAGGIAFLGCQLCLATVKLDMVRAQRRRDLRPDPHRDPHSARL